MVKHTLLAAAAAAFLLAAATAGGAAAGSAAETAPARIVSLSPTATESLYAIGAGTQVVAVDALSNYPKRAPRTRLSGYQPNAEAIAGYRPDLVVVRTDSGLTEALGKLGIRVLVQPEAANLEQAYAQLRELGRATGHLRRATALASSMRARIRAAVASVPRGRPLAVYHELTTDYYSATSKTFIGQIYRLFGLRNIADKAAGAGSGFPKLSGEYVIAANPDLVFLADSECCGQSLATVAARPGWDTIAAVRERRVIRLDDDVSSRWGPRVVGLVRTVAGHVLRARS
jgi:iron complex transport system substrate-binding protein